MAEPIKGFDSSGDEVVVYGKAQFNALSLTVTKPEEKKPAPKKRTTKRKTASK